MESESGLMAAMLKKERPAAGGRSCIWDATRDATVSHLRRIWLIGRVCISSG